MYNISHDIIFFIDFYLKKTESDIYSIDMTRHDINKNNKQQKLFHRFRLYFHLLNSAAGLRIRRFCSAGFLFS